MIDNNEDYQALLDRINNMGSLVEKSFIGHSPTGRVSIEMTLKMCEDIIAMLETLEIPVQFTTKQCDHLLQTKDKWLVNCTDIIEKLKEEFKKCKNEIDDLYEP